MFNGGLGSVGMFSGGLSLSRNGLIFHAPSSNGLVDTIGKEINFFAETSGAKRYVDATGGLDTNNGLTKETAWQTMTKVNATVLAAGTTVYFKGGEGWTAEIACPGSGSAGNPITYSYLPGWGVGLPRISKGGVGRGIYLNNRQYIIINGFEIIGSGSSGIACNGGNNSIIQNCIIRNGIGQGINTQTATGLVVRNCVIAGMSQDGILSENAAASATVTNCTITGNGYYGIRRTAGAITYDHCTITGNTAVFGSTVSAGVTDGGYNINYSPAMTKGKIADTFWVLTIDDRDIDYWNDVAAALAPYNGKLTAYLARYPANNNTGSTDDLPALVAAGHEIGNHTWSHVNLTITTFFAVSSTNASPTVNVDVANSQIVFTTTTPGNTVTYPWGADTTVQDLIDDVSGLKGWNIGSVTSGGTPKLSGIKDSGGAQACPYTVLPDISAPNYQFWENEIGANGEWIETVTGVAPVTQSYPGNNTNADLRAWLAARGDYIGARAGTGNSFSMSSLEIFNVNTFNHLSWVAGDGSEVDVRKRTDHLYEWGQQQGGICTILCHNTTELTAQQVGWIADQLDKKGVQIVTMATACASIRSTHATTDGLTFTRTYADVFDGHLLSVSPCIGAGVDPYAAGEDGFDADGYKIRNGTLNLPDGHWIDGPDVGAYAYGGDDKFYARLTIVSGTGPADWVVKLPAAPHIIAILGLDSTWFDASGVPKEVAFLSLGDDVKIFDGSKGIVVIYSIDMSAKATQIHRVTGAS